MDINRLFKEAREGSSAAQKCLFDEYAGRMQILCRRYVKNKEDAEETMLNGFYKFFKNLPAHQYQGPASFFAWLKKIMVNECLMFLRSKNVFTMIADSTAEELILEEDVLDRLSAVEIFNIIVQLPVGYRTIFNLFVIEGIPHAAIASLLGITEGTSKSQLSKAKSLLQKILIQNGTDYVKRKSK